MKDSRPRRRTLRLKGYDYSQPGAYFITVCAHQRKSIFGTVADKEIRLNVFGEIVQECWRALLDHFKHIDLDAFVVMPNHIHGIVILGGSKRHADQLVGAQHAAPLQDARASHRNLSASVKPGSLGAIVRSYKSAATRRVNQQRCTPGAPLWQLLRADNTKRGCPKQNSRLYSG